MLTDHSPNLYSDLGLYNDYRVNKQTLNKPQIWSL